MAYGAGSGGQVNAEVGYGLPVGRFVGTPRVGFATSDYGRDYRLGYNLAAFGGEADAKHRNQWPRLLRRLHSTS